MSLPMTMPKSEFLREAKARGFIHQITDEAALDAKLAAGTPQVAYIGFDATADLLPWRQPRSDHAAAPFQRTGHRPLALMGGGTTKIGDPSGKDEARKLLSEDDIAANIRGIRRIPTSSSISGRS
jgi:tyrosyl-tRNA synthetase